MANKKWLDLQGKVIIVTGGSSGIGEHIVKNLSENDAIAVVADLKFNESFNNTNIVFEECNVADIKSVTKMVENIFSKYGKIDGLVNNAGVSRPRMLVDYYGKHPEYEITEEDFDFMTAVNQKGVLLCSQAVARKMISQKSGVIINMCSAAGLKGSRGQSIYSATKGAIHSFAMSWAKELGQFNIRVLSIAPDVNERTPMNNDENIKALAYTRGTEPKNILQNTDTDFSKSIPLARPGKLDEIADLVSFLMSEHSSYITSTCIDISGGKISM